jgi:hypothetical protein
MKHIYLLTIGVLLITNMISLWYLQLYKKYSIKLFVRAWALERKLIHIYKDSTPEVQLDIQETLDKITPL